MPTVMEVIRTFYNHQGTYDDDKICTAIDGLDVFLAVGALLANDISGVGVLDDVLIPIVGGASATCAIEDNVETFAGNELGCPSNDFEYELWVLKPEFSLVAIASPVPQAIVIPTCGGS